MEGKGERNREGGRERETIPLHNHVLGGVIMYVS